LDFFCHGISKHKQHTTYLPSACVRRTCSLLTLASRQLRSQPVQSTTYQHKYHAKKVDIQRLYPPIMFTAADFLKGIFHSVQRTLTKCRPIYMYYSAILT